MPELTVLMAVYNAEPYVDAAIKSILSQTFADFEFLILNDGSIDGSRDRIASYADPRIRLIDNPENLGLTATLNRGLALAQSPIVARQDADDLSHPERLEKQIAHLRSHPHVALLGAQGRSIDHTGKYLEPMDRALEETSIRWENLFYNSFIHTAVAFRTAIARDLGGYDETVCYCQDYHLWVRFMREHQVANLPERLVSRRVHPASMTHALQHIRLSESKRAGQQHLETVLGAADLNDAYAALIDFLQTDAPGAFRDHIQTFREILHRFQQRHPETRTSVDFQNALLRQYRRMISQLQTRRQGLRMCAETLHHMPGAVFSLPWHRIIARALTEQ